MLQRILIMQTASLGDVILSTSLAETLHKQYPSAMIDYLVKSPHELLFEGHPFINKVLVWEKDHRKYYNLINIIKTVRSRKYDAVINVQRFATSGLIAGLSGAPYRAGFKKNPLSFMLTHKAVHIISGETHEIYRNGQLIKPLTDLKPELPKLYPTKADFESTEKWKDRPYITISPASLYFTKQLPMHKWIEMIDNIPDEIPVMLIGSKHDIPLCEEIYMKCDEQHIINMAGRLSFLESAALMKDAMMNYVNDSAPQHLASAVNGNVTAIFLSTVPKFGFGPLSDNSYIVETNVPLACKPCGIHGHQQCPEGHFKCAETISVSQLLLPLNNYEQRDSN
ncbi:MAG: glycosyltransferase family 9 protein [Chloroflexota bacterium]|nr:glycosyltransferase family 9 protein [Lentimicrobium sp.]